MFFSISSHFFSTQIYSYDCRKTQVILSKYELKYEYNSDEINEIKVSSDNKFLASCDDTGKIVIIDIKNNKLHKVLSQKHTNVFKRNSFSVDSKYYY